MNHLNVPFQYKYDSLPQLNKVLFKSHDYPIPEYKYYNPTYKINKVKSVTQISNDHKLVLQQKYDSEGYMVEENSNVQSHPLLPDNQGHHYYTYSNDRKLVLDSVISINSTVSVKHKYLFDSDLRILSHYIFSNNHLLPDSTLYTYDSIGNCKSIVSFYKNYIDDGLTVQIIKNGEVNSMRSDTIEINYDYHYNQMSALMTKDNGRLFIYGTTEIMMGPVPGSRYMIGGEFQIFDSYSRIIEIETRGETVQFFYKKNVVSIHVIYGVNEIGSVSDERAVTEFTFHYDKHGHLKKIRYFTNCTYPPGYGQSKVHSEKVRYNKNGLVLNNSFGSKMIYEYFK